MPIDASLLEEEYKALLQESKLISEKIAVTAQMIMVYGGNIPQNKEEEDGDIEIDSTGEISENYPQNATWKERIDWALIYKGNSTAQEISDTIILFEPLLDPIVVRSMVTQYASAMSIGEKATLVATKVGKKNVYSFK